MPRGASPAPPTLPGWTTGPAGALIPEPVLTPLGDLPDIVRGWFRCAVAACPRRVEVIGPCDSDEPAERAEALRHAFEAAAAVPGALLCGPCQRGDPLPVVIETPRAPRLDVELQNNLRSGRALGSSAVYWRRAQDHLRAVAYADPARFHALAPLVNAELRAHHRAADWYPFWVPFFRTYRLEIR